MRKTILIFGATGYLGKYMVQASVAMGHITYAYTRPLKQGGASDDDDLKFKTIQDFKSLGVTIVEGELNDHGKLVSILRQVEIVISTLPVPQYLDQLKIITAMKEANIERFIPSEYGCEADRIVALPPFQALLDNKKIIRRAIEAAKIPYTYIIGNVLARYFIHYLFFRGENCNDKTLTIYGSGETKVVWNCEEDVAAYTIRAATDSRTLNKIFICKPRKNIASQLDVISLWEKKIDKPLSKIHMQEDEMIKLTAEPIPLEISIPMSILHCVFIKGDQLSIEFQQDDLEASTLYLDYKYTSIHELLEISIANPPIVELSKFV